MTRKLQTLVLGAIVAMTALGGTASAQYGGGLGSGSTTVGPGGTISLNGEGYAGDALISFTMFSTPVDLGTTKANGQGAFSATVKIPADTEPGTHRIEASGEGAGGGTLVLSTTITVTGASGGSGDATAAGASAPGGALAATGLDVILLGSIALGLIGVGVALVVARRRRPQAS